MKANQPVNLKIKKGDLVKVVKGSHKGKTGKVLGVKPKEHKILIEKIGVVKRHIRPSQINPRGGTKDVHIPIEVSKVKLVKAAKTEAKKTSAKGGKKK